MNLQAFDPEPLYARIRAINHSIDSRMERQMRTASDEEFDRLGKEVFRLNEEIREIDREIRKGKESGRISVTK